MVSDSVGSSSIGEMKNGAMERYCLRPVQRRASFLYPTIKHYVGAGTGMKRTLMDILACPIDKYHPLELHVFEEKDEIVEGLMLCPKCLRWFPIRDEIPEMLPDELREKREDVSFMRKWENKIPNRILVEGKPFNLKKERV